MLPYSVETGIIPLTLSLTLNGIYYPKIVRHTWKSFKV